MDIDKALEAWSKYSFVRIKDLAYLALWAQNSRISRDHHDNIKTPQFHPTACCNYLCFR